MKIAFNAGKFEVETWTDGYPNWTKITYEDKELCSIHHSEIKDLIYCLERLRGQAQGEIGDKYKHEFD